MASFQPGKPEELVKGKIRVSKIIELTPEPPQPPPFILPLLHAACWDSAALWPKQISSNDLPGPPPFDAFTSSEIEFRAETGSDLGNLLLQLLKWRHTPGVIDLTSEVAACVPFSPPPNTSIIPVENAADISFTNLLGDGISYHMYGH